MDPLEQPNERTVPELLRQLVDTCSRHPDNLALVEAKSREDLYSDIACFLKSHYDRGVFFKLEKKDLEDFLLLNLFTQRLLGLWISLGLAAQGDMGCPDPRLLQAISEFQYSEYNAKSNTRGILADFDIVGKFVLFKKSRVRLSSLESRKKNLGGAFFEENLDQFEFLRQSESIEKWFYEYSQSKVESREEETQKSRLAAGPTDLSLPTKESFFKFKSEYECGLTAGKTPKSSSTWMMSTFQRKNPKSRSL